jgi:hypothetical protein
MLISGRNERLPYTAIFVWKRIVNNPNLSTKMEEGLRSIAVTP